MFRLMVIACLVALGVALASPANAQVFGDDARALDVQQHFNSDRHFDSDRHFHRDWDDRRFGRGDAIDRTLQRGADPLRSNFGPTANGFNGPVNTGVQNYGTPNYFNYFYGTPYGGETFPGQWYYQNRRYVSPYGGLNRYPSDRYFTR
jgi:hypothetical protein